MQLGSLVATRSSSVSFDARSDLLRIVLACLVAFGLLFHSRGVTIIPIYDTSILNDPKFATIQATINAAAALYQNNFSDDVRVRILFKEHDGYPHGENSGTNGFLLAYYSDYLAALTSHATTRRDEIALQYLPGGPTNPVNGTPYVELKSPLANALGFGWPNPYFLDATIDLWLSDLNLSPAEHDPDKPSLYATACHEIDEVLGFGSALENSDYATGPVQPEDLFRWDLSLYRRSFELTPIDALSFSFDGVIHFMYFNPSKPGDYGDWWGLDGAHVQNEQQPVGATPEPDVELTVMDVIGYTRLPGTVWLDFSYAGPSHSGRFNSPFVTFDEAATAIPGSNEVPNGTVLVKSGTTPGPMRIATPMKVIPVGGPVTLGRP